MMALGASTDLYRRAVAVSALIGAQCGVWGCAGGGSWGWRYDTVRLEGRGSSSKLGVGLCDENSGHGVDAGCIGELLSGCGEGRTTTGVVWARVLLGHDFVEAIGRSSIGVFLVDTKGSLVDDELVCCVLPFLFGSHKREQEHRHNSNSKLDHKHTTTNASPSLKSLHLLTGSLLAFHLSPNLIFSAAQPLLH